MSFALRHPTGMTTHTFSPGSDADVSRSRQERVDSAIGKLTSDFTLYSYRFAPSAWRYTRGLSTLTVSGMSDLESFLDSVSGEAFDFTDGTCGPQTGWVTVKLAPESYVRAYQYAAGGYIEVEFSMIDA